MFYSIQKYEIILFWLWFYEIIIICLKDASPRWEILNGNDCACLRFQEICLYFDLYKFFRGRLWSPPPYLEIRQIRLQNKYDFITFLVLKFVNFEICENRSYKQRITQYIYIFLAVPYFKKKFEQIYHENKDNVTLRDQNRCLKPKFDCKIYALSWSTSSICIS